MSEKIKTQHLQRKAIVYVRQSSAFQVSHNLESQKLQYAMQERLRHMGWREIEVVDEDLGRSASGTVARSGFERMVAEVCLGKVGAVAARELSRFARNSREWQQLIEVCRVVDAVLIDQEAVYAPRQSNDRLLLGLKGSLNEYELDLLRQRSVEARREKAKRGELSVAAPVGYVKGEANPLEKHPDRRVQQAIQLVFSKLLELGTVRQSLMWFLEHALQLPVATPKGEISWKRPSYGSLYRILTNPVYGGAYAYGKTQQNTPYEAGERAKLRRVSKPREQWLALIPNAHEGYVSWEQFEHIQRTITGNLLGSAQPGAVRDGAALLAALLRCRRCGRKLVVRYTGNDNEVLRYSCWRGWTDNGERRCIAIGGAALDAAIGREVLRVVQPAAMEAAVLANEEQAKQEDEVLAALQRDLQAAAYAVRRAQKQYDTVDPENRLVAEELESRWNQALRQVQAIESRIEQHTAARSNQPMPTLEEFEALAAELETLWNSREANIRLKKRIVRTLIEEIIVDVNAEAGEIVLIIHWKGGVHTELRLSRRRRGQNSAHTSKEIVDAVRILARICTDKLIAGVLTRNALLTGRGNRWTQERVASLRSTHQIACYCPENRSRDGWLNLNEAARLLGVSAATLRLAVMRGEIEAEHPLSDGPWVFNRSKLQSEPARKLVARCAQQNRTPAARGAQQDTFDFSTT